MGMKQNKTVLQKGGKGKLEIQCDSLKSILAESWHLTWLWFCRLYHSIVTILLIASLALETESQECTKNGFFRHPEDCTRFYRCVDLTGRGYFQKYTFSCPVGTVFDENVSVCNHPWAAPPCEESESEETTEASVGVVEEGDEEEESVRLSLQKSIKLWFLLLKKLKIIGPLSKSSLSEIYCNEFACGSCNIKNLSRAS